MYNWVIWDIYQHKQNFNFNRRQCFIFGANCTLWTSSWILSLKVMLSHYIELRRGAALKVNSYHLHFGRQMNLAWNEFRLFQVKKHLTNVTKLHQANNTIIAAKRFHHNKVLSVFWGNNAQKVQPEEFYVKFELWENLKW